ncbi:TPA: phage baseplate assembly protein V [Enterobacter roggenkampii]|uniref:phage baseplate assembly protein V n=1 Tax=Enterobacter TaxID=547 RepID=UPI000668932E|nr:MULTISPECIES: phage baseplate assembly protein V [Enterobacter]MDU2079054.1 phage baseplate assembly protein V [Enterobacter sp.]
MNHLMNMMAMRAQQSMGSFAGTRQGVITAYDPKEYAIKASLQPTGEETGWIPLGTPWAGNGWGFAAGPMIGAEVQIDFDSGTIGVGMAGGQFYNNEDRSPGPPSGELWIVHQSGSMLKFLNSGKVVIQDSAGTSINLNGDGSRTDSASGAVTQTASGGMTIVADIQNNGNFQSSGSVADMNGAHGTMNTIRTTYNGHTHHENGAGSNTNQPNQQIS